MMGAANVPAMRCAMPVVRGLFLAFAVAFCAAGEARAFTVSSEELIERAKDLDSRTVVYRGEVVTAVMRRGSHAWINVNDGANAIGVWCDADLVRDITYVGTYRTGGDIVEVEGIFNRACREHGGELDIHAYKLRIAQKGCRRTEALSRGLANAAIAAFVLVALIVIRFRRRF